MIELRPYRPTDAPRAFLLWQASLGRDWPLTCDQFAAHIRAGLVAFDDDELVGICAYGRRGERAALHLLVVDRSFRGAGIGTALHAACLAELAALGVTHVSLGGFPGPYLWPGLPDDSGNAHRFLARRGWVFDGACFDLTGALGGFRTPAELTARLGPGISYRVADVADGEPLAAFEERHFPTWAASFESPCEQVIVALSGDQIVGTLLAGGPESPLLWRELLGPDSGTIGCVGVAPQAEGRGIGTGMVAYAMEQLQADGVTTCYVDWVHRLSFYGRLGFRPWRRYQTATLEL